MARRPSAVSTDSLDVRDERRKERNLDEGRDREITDRQLEVLVHVARGRTNRQVGAALGISERTVRNHLRTILRKLSSADRTRAVVIAIERGWIPIPIEPEGEPLASQPARMEAPLRQEAEAT